MSSGLLSGSVAIVTGGTRGIGRAIVRDLCRAGADCIFTYVSRNDLAISLQKEIESLGRKAIPLRLNVKDFENAGTVVEIAKREFGRIDILVNNAGITRDRSFIMMNREEWHEVIDTDLNGVYNMTRACIITFLKQKKGNIVNISSVSGIHPLSGQVNYAASKAGVIGFTKALAKEVASYNVRVNAVAPGFIMTDMLSSLNENYKKRLMDVIPCARFGYPEEISRVVVFLVSDESKYITGQVIIVDGGLSLNI